MAKSLVVYHFPCNDGFGAAFAAWLSLGPDGAAYLPWNYNREDEFERDVLPKCAGRDVYVLDFSFSKALTCKLISTAGRFIWLDHHKSAFENWLGAMPETRFYFDSDHPTGADCAALSRRYISLDDRRSGAMLAWDYFHPGELSPLLFRHLDDYDRWQFRIPGTREFDRNLRSLPYDFNLWKELVDDMERPKKEQPSNTTPYGYFLTEGAAILRAHEATVAAIVDAAKQPCTISASNIKASGLSANVPGMFASDVGHALAVESGTFGMTWYVRYDGSVSCSLRSEGEYDVSVIARWFGGGGHRNAASFRTDIDTLLGWIPAQVPGVD